MNVYYFHAPEGNFGDDINEWLWSELMGEDIKNISTDIILVGIGTILNQNIPTDKNKIVFGSGAGYYSVSDDFGDEKWDIQCVRGPLTAALLDLPEKKAVTDGAILVAALEKYIPVPEEKRHGVVFMPHVGALETGAWKDVCEKAGVEFLDPRQDSKVTLDRIRHAKLVLADAMHAAIIADTVRVPWIPFTTSVEINSFKWLDWTLSMNVPYEPIHLNGSTFLDRIKNALYLLFRLQYKLPETLSKEDILKTYKKILILRKRKWHVFAQRVIIFFLKHLSRMIKTYPFLDKWMKACSKKAIKSAVVKVECAAQQKGYLSDANIHTKRLSQMRKLFDDMLQEMGHEQKG